MTSETRRLTYLDNTRTLMVLFIVLLHAACAYSNLIPWWAVRDNTGITFDLIVIIVDGFALPVLFLVAGLFAPSSLARHGTAGFILGKLKRFGLPTMALLYTLIPVGIFLGYRGIEGFDGFYLNWLRSSLDWHFYYIDSMEAIAGHEWDITPMHLWFITMLLVFFICYALFRRVRPRRPNNAPRFGISILACLGLAALGYSLLSTVMMPMVWCKMGPFILFQPVRLPYYAAFFILGAALAEQGWLEERGAFSGRWWLWLSGFLISTLLLVVLSGQYATHYGPIPLLPALAGGMLRTLTAFTATAGFMGLMQRFRNTPTPLHSNLAGASYDIYLLHLPLCIYLQYTLLHLQLGSMFKMVVVFLFSTAFSWLLSPILRKII